MKIRCMGKLSLSRRIVNKLYMLMSTNTAYMFMLLVGVLIFTNGGIAQGQCDAADALLKAQLYEDAQANYTALLNHDPQLSCAQAGILAVQQAQAKKSYELGRAYENASQLKEARGAYVAALEKYPNYILAQEALENVSDNKFAAVQTLANLGYYTEAADRLKTVVEENPGIEVPENLTYLPGGNIPLWGYLRSLIQRWGQPVGEIVILLLGVCILILRILPWLWSLYKPRLDIQDFDNGATGLQIGKGMMAMMEESLMQLGQKSMLGCIYQLDLLESSISLLT
jgi:tetratricopeptide (TPR) repeat protein